jgi:hypothetical protein
MKCAGNWLKKAMMEACPNAMAMEHYPSLADINLPNVLNVFFVRNPLDWYSSYFAFRQSHGWEFANPDSGRELDRCFGKTFDEFIGKCLDRPPFLTYLYDQKMCGLADEVGRVENIASDLVWFLRLSGEPFDEEKLRSTPKQNVSALKPVWNKFLASAILKHEKEVVNKYYRGQYASLLPGV